MTKLTMTVKTNKVGSESTVDLGYTQEEWDAMSEKEQQATMVEAVFEAVDYWINE